MKIKGMKWAERASECSSINGFCDVKRPVVDGERLLVVTIMPNLGKEYPAYERRLPEARIVCSKKGTSYVLDRDGKKKRSLIKELRSVGMAKVQMSEADRDKIEKYIGSDGNRWCLYGLIDWVEKQWKRKRLEKAGGFAEGDYALCPQEMPEGLIDWVREFILPADNVILYQKGGWNGFCYHCGSDVKAATNRKRFKNSQIIDCPNCGKLVTCYIENGASWKVENVDNIVAAQKGPDGIVFFRQWRLRRDYSGRWDEVEPYLKEVARYAIKGDKTAKWQREVKWCEGMYAYKYSGLKEWTMWQGNNIYDGWYSFFRGNLPEALEGTTMQYAPWHEYTGKNLIYFLEYFQKYPVIEFLWKAGYKRLVNQKIEGLSKENQNAILWQRKTLKECFKFPMWVLKMLPPGDWDMNAVMVAEQLYAKNKNLSQEELKYGIILGRQAVMVEAAIQRTSVAKVVKYLQKQIYDTENLYSVCRTYSDYLRECEQLQLSLEEKEVLFPENLRTAHERTMRMVRFQQSEVEKEKFQKVVAKLEQLAWEDSDFIIRPARGQEELIKEGKDLHHCVAGYVNKMAEGRSCIFFVRKKDEPQVPYYTLELNPKSNEIVQCRTENNRSFEHEEAVKGFVENWLSKKVKKRKVA